MSLEVGPAFDLIVESTFGLLLAHWEHRRAAPLAGSQLHSGEVDNLCFGLHVFNGAAISLRHAVNE
jgi:hypothetical protein